MALKANAGFRFINPVLPVEDLAASFEFYESKLGLLPRFDDGAGFGSVWAGDIAMFLNEKRAPFSPQSLVFYLDTVDQLFEQYRAAGVEILEEPETHSWGMRDFVIRELNGHIFTIGCLDESQADYTGIRDYPSEE